MTIPQRQTATLGMPWEKTYGYAQAVRVGDTLYVSGQLGHDDAGNIVGAAPPDAHGDDVDHSNMAAQMRQAYVNAAKVLGLLGATLQHVSRRSCTHHHVASCSSRTAHR